MADVNSANQECYMNNKTITNEYLNYREFKGWNTFFNPTEAEVSQLDYEFRDVPIKPGTSLLDVGFGNGALLKWASNKFANIAGIELNHELIREAKKFEIRLYSSLNTVESKSIDILTFMDVLEHLEIEEINQILDEAARVLKGGGYLVARFPNCQSPAGLIEQFGDITHKTMLSAPILSVKLREYGFKITSIAGATPVSEFPIDLKAKILLGLKKGIRKIIQSVYKYGFGTGKALLSPSIIIVAKLD